MAHKYLVKCPNCQTETDAHGEHSFTAFTCDHCGRTERDVQGQLPANWTYVMRGNMVAFELCYQCVAELNHWITVKWNQHDETDTAKSVP